jgi:radical SAM superfamily enzyme YgiQ (UPF0313 family)
VYLRQRSAKNVIAGITELQKTHKFKSVRFHDDVFAFNVKWLREFKEEYVKHVNLPFHCYVTPSTAKEEIIRLLAEAGCTKISIGVQSGCEAIRTKLLNRKHTDDDIVEAAHRIRRHGIKLSAEFIFGFPEETPEDMWKSLNLSDRLNANYSPSFVFYPYPKTELAEYCLEKGYLNKKNYELVKKGYGSYHTTGWLDLPYMDDVYKFAKILPIYTVCPKFLRPLLRKIIKMKYGYIHKFLAVLAIPAIDPQEFIKRVKEMPRMFFATRKALRVDDWKKKPKKAVTREKTAVETFADQEKITPKPYLAKDPLTSESKAIAEPWRSKIDRNRPIKDSA